MTAAWLEQSTQRIEAELEASFIHLNEPAKRLQDAMRYAVMGGGKRIRPLLVYAAASLGGQAFEQVPGIDAVAVAVELFHTYSLVHDDLPAMDNDDLRRGRATVHKAYDEATALLVGDALQALAFELLLPPEFEPTAVQAELCRLLAVAAGHAGMAGGQAIDLASVGVALDESALRQMHRLKTGALLEASVMLGAACAGLSPNARAQLHQYAQALGLAFQVVDDILDVTADSATLGKTAGKDAANDKPTYVSLLGLTAAQTLALQLQQQALAALQASGLPNTHALAALAARVVQRST